MRRVDATGETYVEKVIEVDGRPLKVINGTQPLHFEASMENREWFLKSLKPDVIIEQHSRKQDAKLDTAAAHDQLDDSNDATGSSSDDENASLFVRKEVEVLTDKSKLPTGVFFTPSKRRFTVKKEKGVDCKRASPKYFHVRRSFCGLKEIEETAHQRRRAVHYLETGEVMPETPKPRRKKAREADDAMEAH